MKSKKASIAERNYLKIYKDTIKLFGHNGKTSTFELNAIGRKLFRNKYLGSFPQDKLPRNMVNKYALLNVDTTGMPGTHWVGVAGLPNKKVMVFDSFGRASKHLLPIVYGGRSVIDTQYDKEQKKIQESCGQYSMAWLIYFDKYGPKLAQTI